MGVTETLSRYFDLAERGTNLRTETLAGLTTFLTMSYIIIVNPALLSIVISPEGVSGPRVFQMLAVVTILASVAGMLVMAFYADLPFGLAPGMGLNAFFVAVVLSPDRAYTDREAARVRAFVRDGGSLVVAEDFGSNADPLLDAVGAGTGFDGTLLRDERSEWRSPAMPVATGVTNRSETPYTEEVSALTLNYGTALEPGPNATVLVRSSPFAYLDADGDGSLGGNESLGARPVVAVEPVGEGRVVAVSDASVFLNAMLEREGNRRFALNLLGSGERVLVDASHSTVPPLSAALVAVRSSPLLGFGLAVVVFSLVGAWGAGWTRRLRSLVPGSLPWGGRRGADRPVPSEDVAVDALVAYLRRRHPDWEEDRVRRVAQGVLPDGAERREDE